MAEMKYRKQILKGFQLLDKKKPGWKVDLRKLDMSDPCNCTVGQNYPSFVNGLESLGVLLRVVSHGFSFEDNSNYEGYVNGYAILTKEVKILIKEWRKK